MKLRTSLEIHMKINKPYTNKDETRTAETQGYTRETKLDTGVQMIANHRN